jgi:hypothetical protein
MGRSSVWQAIDRKPISFQVQVFGYAQPPLPQNRSNQVTARLVNGRWAPGRSGNPGGRPGGVAEVRELARTHTAEAIECLLKEMRDGDTSHARIAAANALLDRGWGRPTQPLAGDADNPVVVNITAEEERRAEVDAAIDAAFREYPREEERALEPPPSLPPPTTITFSPQPRRRTGQLPSLAIGTPRDTGAAGLVE